MTDLADQLRREREQNRRLARRNRDLEAENRELRRRLEDQITIDNYRVIPPAYTSAMATLATVAHHGWQRPLDLGGTIIGSAPSSTTPRYSEAAYRVLRAEREHLRRRAIRLAGPGDTASDSGGLLGRLVDREAS